MNYWEVGFNQSYRCCSQKVLLISLWLRLNENIDYKNHRDWLQIVELITVAKIREQTIKKWLLQTDSAIIVGWGGFAVQWELTLHLHYCNRVIQRSIQTLQHITQLKIVHLCWNVTVVVPHLKTMTGVIRNDWEDNSSTALWLWTNLAEGGGVSTFPTLKVNIFGQNHEAMMGGCSENVPLRWKAWPFYQQQKMH